MASEEVDIDLDEWAVVKTSSQNGYIGRFNFHVDYFIERMAKGEPVRFEEAFDFVTPIRPVQQPSGQVGIQRDPLVLPLDFTLTAVPLYILVTVVYFCKDMKEADRATYKNFIKAAMAMSLGARAKQAGIEVTNRMPAIKTGAH